MAEIQQLVNASCIVSLQANYVLSAVKNNPPIWPMNSILIPWCSIFVPGFFNLIQTYINTSSTHIYC